MSLNLVYKILADHMVSGELAPGNEIGIRIDQTLMHDGTGQMATLQFEALGLDAVKTKQSVTYTDHNTLQVAFMNMDDHHFLASSGRKFGIHYSKAGNGICHQVHLERFSKPGQTLLGADSHTTTCGFCVGVGQAPRSGGVSVRTSNRNFPGRSGTRDARLYLVSPESAAATALNGFLTDPRSLDDPVKISLPDTFAVDDSMIIPPEPKRNAVEIVRGPNIAPLPEFEPMPDSLEGEMLLTLGNDITTDEILPSGSEVFSLRANIPAISKYVFKPIDPTFPERAGAAGMGFVAGGRNFGQGSSREHAALAPRYLGVRAVMARSFARIYKANLVNFGILPLELIDDSDNSVFEPGDRIKMEGIHKALSSDGDIIVQNLTRQNKISCKIDLSPRSREILLDGGLLANMRKTL